MRIKAVILEGEADPEAIAALRAALADQQETVMFASPSIANIIARVAFETGLRAEHICGPSRCAPFFRARCAVTMIAYRISGKSSTVIGRAMGGRDHATILNQKKRAAKFLDADPAFRRLVRRVLEHFDREVQP